MTRRLATMCFMVMFLVGISSPSVRAQESEYSRASLNGISALSVMVEDLPDSSKILGLTKGAVQTDVELKLRLAGMRVVTSEENLKLPGKPYIYVRVNLGRNATAVYIQVELLQNVLLERNGKFVPNVTTWEKSTIGSNPTAQDIRNQVKDLVDEFLNAWLSVNPKN